MINDDSRYRTATLQTVTGPDEVTRQEMRPAWPRSRQITYTYYRVSAADRIDTIANDFYSDGRLWWVIADANPEVLDWLDLAPGDVIRVPNV